MTALAEVVGGIFERGNVFRHRRLAIVAGFAFFNGLSFNIGKPFAFAGFAVMAGFALQTLLMSAVGKKGRLSWRGRINRGLQDNFRSALIDGVGLSLCAGQTAKRQQNAAGQYVFHTNTP